MMRFVFLLFCCLLTLSTYSQGLHCGDPLGSEGTTNLPPVTIEASNPFQALTLFAIRMENFDPGLSCAGCPDGQDGCKPHLTVDWSYEAVTINSVGDFVFTGATVDWELYCSGCRDKDKSDPEPLRYSSPDFGEQFSVKGFPNPAKEMLYLEFSGVEVSMLSGHRLEIYNMNGQLLSICSDCNKVDVSTLPAGIYHLRIQLADGQSATTKFHKVK